MHPKEVISLPEEDVQEQSPAPASTGGGDDNLIAAVSYLWILSVIILLVKKDSDYVTFHARQGCLLFAASIVLVVLSYFPFVGYLFGIAQLVIVVAVIVGFIQAYGGKKYKMPLIGDYAEKIKF